MSEVFIPAIEIFLAENIIATRDLVTLHVKPDPLLCGLVIFELAYFKAQKG